MDDTELENEIRGELEAVDTEESEPEVELEPVAPRDKNASMIINIKNIE